MEQQILFIDCCTNSGFNFELCESTQGGLTKFRGKMQEADTVNKNHRIYPFSVLDENVKRLQEAITERRLIGELDHPTDSIIHFANASHIVTKLWWEGNVLMGEGEILNTPHGKVLRALLNDGVKVGISSRGVGNGKTTEDGTLVIGESYKLITFDAVADPSTFAAFQSKVVSSPRRESIDYGQNFVNSSTKNESTSIDRINKEALISF
jgi:hypothetical protein